MKWIVATLLAILTLSTAVAINPPASRSEHFEQKIKTWSP